MNTVVLVGCFVPLIIIFIIMKLIVWVESVNSESNYVRKEPLRKRGPYTMEAYIDVDEKDDEWT
jgi:hypothetical protein